jgi:hypothetical protein
MRAGLKTQKTGTRNASRVNTKGKAFRVDQRTIDLDPLTLIHSCARCPYLDGRAFEVLFSGRA